jgi:hypothetical protein
MNPPTLPIQQKLVTVYLDNTAYMTGGIFASNGLTEKHGSVEEHLAQYLQAGWRIVQLHGFGGNAEGLAARGWLSVLLEKQP